MNYYLLNTLKLFIFFIILSGCAEKDKKNQIVTLVEHQEILEPEVINLPHGTEILKPIKILNSNDKYLVVVDDVDFGIIKIFSLPQLNHLYTWGRKGRGPDEMSFVELNEIMTKDNYLIFYEPDFGRLKYYEITDSALINDGEKDLSLIGQSQPLNGLEALNNEYFISSIGFGLPIDSKNEFLMLKANNSGSTKRFGDFPPTELIGSNKYRYFSKVVTSNPEVGMFASFYRLHNSFKIFDFSGNVVSRIIVNDPKLKNSPDGFLYRISAESTEQFIYTYAINATPEEIEQKENGFTPTIEEWDWSGESQNKYLLNHMIHRFIVSETNNLIVGVSVMESDKLFKFSFHK